MVFYTNGGRVELPETGVLPLNHEDVVTLFTLGHCHSLAGALSRLTGWETWALKSDWDDRECPTHMVVKAPDGRFLDINGWHDNDQDFSYGSRIVESYPLELADIEGYRDEEIEMALPYAEALIKEYVPESMMMKSC